MILFNSTDKDDPFNEFNVGISNTSAVEPKNKQTNRQTNEWMNKGKIDDDPTKKNNKEFTPNEMRK